MTALPVWIQVLQALLTPAIAVAVGVIAFMQWRTAHQKLVLDLFGKRLEVYENAGNAVGKVMTSGHLGAEARADLAASAQAATFLFGEDVQQYLDSLWRDCSRLQTLTAALDNGGGEAAAKARTEVFGRIAKFYLTAPEVFGRYMRMDQKLIPTPGEWLAERNKIRLSYADEKQQ